MIKERIRKMSRYKPPIEGRSGKDYVLLDFNEKTTPSSPKVKTALRKFIDLDRLQVYPSYDDLEEKIARYAKVKPGQAMITNGGDQGIDVVFRAFLDAGDKVIIPFPEFAMHYQSAGIQGAEILEPKYKEEGLLPLEEILDLMNDEKVKLVIFSNPNNPTGIITPPSKVEKILIKAKEKGIAVLHDEAYFEFSKNTVADLIGEYDNLYIIRTFSKAFGLVAARAGYVLSKEENIEELLKIRGPYDINMFAKVAVEAALEDVEYMEQYAQEIMERSKPRLEAFLREKGIFFYPSKANFLLLKFPDSEKVIADLKKKNILVRPKPALNGEKAVRVSIGTLKDTEQFIEALGDIL
ncbi:MAG: histidinol-phosphate transaminase [bacterium]|nr:histidinol-phosphate transaminase [bacterium]